MIIYNTFLLLDSIYLIGWLADTLIAWSIDLIIDWLIDWQVD